MATERRNVVQVDPERSMKCLLSVAVRQAVHLALIDSAVPPDNGFWTDEEKAKMQANIYAIPSDAIARMDPGALARNVANRLLGTGGWMVSGVYSGNATDREVFEASILRPDHDSIAELAFDLGLRPTDDGMFEIPDGDDPDA